MMIMTSSNKDIHATKDSFLVAAASYFGLPDGQVMDGSTVVVGADGTLDVVLRVSLTPDDLTGIAGRMKAMAEEQASQPAPASDQAEAPSREQLREQYDGMSKQLRSQYGSFHNYCLARSGVDPYTAPEVVTKVELPAHVYLGPAETTAQQRAMAVGMDEKGNYAIAVEDLTERQRFEHVSPEATADQPRADQLQEDLTEEQARQFAGAITRAANATLRGDVTADQMRQAYVERAMAARARLSGADGKPTSNADDFDEAP